MKKIFYPIRKALYSIQFYRDRAGLISMCETEQEGKMPQDFGEYISMRYFGMQISKSKLLNAKEKIGLRDFCLGYLNGGDPK